MQALNGARAQSRGTNAQEQSSGKRCKKKIAEIQMQIQGHARIATAENTVQIMKNFPEIREQTAVWKTGPGESPVA